MLKPHRLLADRIGSYAEEAKAFVRRRRHHRRPYIRVQFPGGDAVEVPTDSAAAALIARSPAPLEGRSSNESR